MFSRYLYLTLIFLYISCEDPPPLSTGEGAVPPETILATVSQTVFDTSSATIGNFSADTSIYQPWMDWDTTSTNSVTFHTLDEGTYNFIIKSRYNLDNVEQEQALLFKVDAIEGPSLRIFPQHQTASLNDIINIYLYIEEVPLASSVSGLNVMINYNINEFLFLDSLSAQGSLVSDFNQLNSANGGTAFLFNKNQDEGIIDIWGVSDANGVGLSGTGSVYHMAFQVLALEGGANINISGNPGYLDFDENYEETTINFSKSISAAVTIIKAAE